MTVADMLCANLSAFPIWLGHKGEDGACRPCCKKVGGKNLLQNSWETCPAATMQRVQLALRWNLMPDMLLLDEPVSAVDRKGDRGLL